MPRKPKPTLHQGWYYTRAGGGWRKLVPEAEGLEAAERALTSLLRGDRAAAGLPPAPAAGPLLREACASYVGHCRDYYTLPDGRVSSEPRVVRLALGYLERAAGADRPVAQLSFEHLEAARDAMRRTCARKTINQHLGRIRRAVRWWATQKLIPRALGAELRGVENLPAYRGGVTEHEPVEAVAWEHVEPVVGAIGEPWRSLILLQWWSGLRPGEACRIECGWLVATGEAFVVDFGLAHKTGWRGRVKTVPLGPRASAVVRPWLEVAEARGRASLFVVSYFRDAPSLPTPASYETAVRRVCDRLGVPRWSPNQLRHSHATRVRAAFGLEAAQVALGHARADTTQIYAERDAALAAKVAAECG